MKKRTPERKLVLLLVGCILLPNAVYLNWFDWHSAARDKAILEPAMLILNSVCIVALLVILVRNVARRRALRSTAENTASASPGD